MLANVAGGTVELDVRSEMANEVASLGLVIEQLAKEVVTRFHLMGAELEGSLRVE
jgi:hypothetical protein